MNKWIVLDSTYLCHRAYHSGGANLSYEGEPTGVIFKYLKELDTLRSQFATDRIVHCWDHGKGIRETRYPYYKETRRKKAGEPEYEKKQEILRPQIEKLKKVVLPEIGYRNNFWQDGYEADDTIASVIHSAIGKIQECERHDEFVIVSEDQDMYQLLQPNVEVYHPREGSIIDTGGFRVKYGITPDKWPAVKVIAGCKTDDVPKCKGVMEDQACRFLANNPSILVSPLAGKIRTHLKSKQAAENYLLVRLPFKGVKEFDLRDDELDRKAYRKMLARYGIKSIGD